MKKALASLLLSCSALLTQAQDTYWALDGQKVFNTRTQAVIQNTQQTPLYNFSGHFNVVLDKNAEFVFVGQSMTTPPGNPTYRPYIDQVFTIPNKCNRYYVLEERGFSSSASGSGHLIDLEEVDASGSTIGGGYRIFASGETEKWVVSAAKLGASFERKIYHITSHPWFSPGACLFEFTIDKNGNVSGMINGPGSPVIPLATGLPMPKGNYHMAKMSQDGKTIAYVDEYDNFTTYHIPTNTLSWYGFSFGSSAPIMEQATVNGERRWYVSDGNTIGYYEEGTNNFVDITPTSGTAYTLGLGQNSNLALGRDGMMYFANGNGSSPGNLYYFDPQNTGTLLYPQISFSDNCFIIPGAQIATWTGNTYWFGNEVPGEDINAAGGPVNNPSMALSGLTPTPGTYSTIYNCPGSFLWLTLLSPGINAPVKVTLKLGDWDTHDGEFVPASGEYDPITYDGPMAEEENVSLAEYWPNLQTYSGFISLTYRTVTPCGQQIEFTQIYRIVQIEDYANFYLTGPYYCTNALPRKEDLFNFGTPATGVCKTGWVGASTGAVQRPNPVIPAGGNYATEVPDYKIVLEEYDPLAVGGWITLGIIDPNPGITLPNSTSLNNHLTANYFTNNYADITDNNKLFRVTVDFYTTTCGTISKYSYFRIIPGNPSLKGTYDDDSSDKDIEREILNSNLATNTATNAYPNPATDKLNIDWYSSEEGNAYVSLIDVLGKEVYQQKLPAIKGTNRLVLNMAPLAAGVYRYTLYTSDGQSTGNIVKQ